MQDEKPDIAANSITGEKNKVCICQNLLPTHFRELNIDFDTLSKEGPWVLILVHT